MHVVIDGRLVPGTAGGVETALIGLAEGLTQLDPNDCRFTWLTWSGHADVIAEAIGPSHEVVEIKLDSASATARRWVARTLRRWDVFDEVLARIRTSGAKRWTMPAEPRVLKQLRPDAVHFPFQRGFQTDIPTLYQIHDVQHVHLPEFFSREALVVRELRDHALARQASVVVVGTEWTAHDVSTALDISRQKIEVVPVAPPLPAPPMPLPEWILDVVARHEFVITYPAAPWPHKNHRKLFEALERIRSRGIDAILFCPGPQLPRGVDLRAMAAACEVSPYVHVPGFLAPGELTSLLQSSSLLAMPSLFESESLPIWEAFRQSLPVAASDITAIPSQVGDAALLFDPNNADSMADAIATLLTEPALARDYARRGSARVKEISPIASAQAYVRLYRRFALSR